VDVSLKELNGGRNRVEGRGTQWRAKKKKKIFTSERRLWRVLVLGEYWRNDLVNNSVDNPSGCTPETKKREGMSSWVRKYNGNG
jgi:hypothetical protein